MPYSPTLPQLPDTIPFYSTLADLMATCLLANIVYLLLKGLTFLLHFLPFPQRTTKHRRPNSSARDTKRICLWSSRLLLLLHLDSLEHFRYTLKS